MAEIEKKGIENLELSAKEAEEANLILSMAKFIEKRAKARKNLITAQHKVAKIQEQLSTKTSQLIERKILNFNEGILDFPLENLEEESIKAEKLQKMARIQKKIANLNELIAEINLEIAQAEFIIAKISLKVAKNRKSLGIMQINVSKLLMSDSSSGKLGKMKRECRQQNEKLISLKKELIKRKNEKEKKITERSIINKEILDKMIELDIM